MSTEKRNKIIGAGNSTVPFNKQLTLRGAIIGMIGSAVLTMSSLFMALKLGALPWPTIFVALASMFFLRIMGKTNINEINVTHTIMSAGAMTAGGLAFTIPAIYILNPAAEVSFVQLLAITLGGVILGLICTALIRKFFVETQDLPYPMGVAAAETVMAGDEGGKKSIMLFSSLGIAGIFTVIRDVFGKIPSVLLNKKMGEYGSACGIWLSPMLIGVGYIIGPLAIGVWFLGAIVGDFAILLGGSELGFWDVATAANIKSSLGIGIMVGTGIGIIVKGILPKAKEIFGPMFSREGMDSSTINMRWAPLLMAAVAAVFAFVCDLGIVASIVAIIGAWLSTTMSAQVVGQSGINPMEVFGVIIMIAAQAVSNINQVSSIFVVAIVAVTCGLAGDIMNDFKSGHIHGTSPKAQLIGEFMGGIVGAFSSVFVFYIMLKGYGPTAFTDGTFIAPQANMVAALVGGIPHLPAFIVGLVLGVILYIINFPVMTLGLGIYLPFYLSATAFIGGALRFVVMKFFPEYEKGGDGMIVASGMFGGEAIVGVIQAIVIAAQAGFGG